MAGGIHWMGQQLYCCVDQISWTICCITGSSSFFCQKKLCSLLGQEDLPLHKVTLYCYKLMWVISRQCGGVRLLINISKVIWTWACLLNIYIDTVKPQYSVHYVKLKIHRSMCISIKQPPLFQSHWFPKCD